MTLLERGAAHLWDMLDAPRQVTAFSAGLDLDQLLADARSRYAIERALEIVGAAGFGGDGIAASRSALERDHWLPQCARARIRCNRLSAPLHRHHGRRSGVDRRPGSHTEVNREPRVNTSSLVQKLWNYCNVLRDDGMSYGDYVEQLTYLLFLKIADERTEAPYHQPSIVPQQYSWSSLIKKDGDELFDHYRHALDALGKEKGLLGLIFNKAQNKFQDPVKLQQPLVGMQKRVGSNIKTTGQSTV